MKKILLLLSVFIVILSLSSCFRFRISDSTAFRKLGKLPYDFQVHRYTIDGYHTIRYFEIGCDSQPVVIFVHGGLGTSRDFMKYLKDTALLNHYKMIVPDRYGHGYSDFGQTEVNLQKQAEYLYPILKKARLVGTKTILVGHSYGGTVAARLAMDYPNMIDNLVLSSPAIDPQNEKKFWFNKILDFWAIKWMMPQNFIIANDEKLAHAQQCLEMEPYWNKITMPTVYIHGRNDLIVPFINYEFAKKHLLNAPVKYVLRDSLNHDFFVDKPKILTNIILNINAKKDVYQYSKMHLWSH